jgi:hypothetical protein
VGATLADALRRGAAAAGGERANSLATSIIFGIESGRGDGAARGEISREGGEGRGAVAYRWGMEWRTEAASQPTNKKGEKPTQRNAEYK